MNRFRLACVAVGGIAAATALASPALAGFSLIPGHSEGSSHGLKYMAGSFSLSASYATVLLNCPDSTAVVGGGVRPSGPAAQSHVLDDDPPAEGDIQHPTGWLGGVDNDGPGDVTVTVYGICRKAGFAKLRYVLPKPVVLPADGDASLKAKCPHRYEVIGGGAGRSGVTNVSYSVSAPFDGGDRDHRPDDGWRAKAHNNVDSTAGGLNVEAICLKTRHALHYRSDSDKVGIDSSRTLRVNCPTQDAVSDGGMSIGGDPASRFIHSMRPQDSSKDANSTPDDRWTATARVNKSASKAKTTVYAICLS